MRNIFLLLTFLLLPSIVYSQSVQTSFDKKIIYTDSLNLPKNASVQTILLYIPELLQRPGASGLIQNHDLQIEGMSIGDAKDIALQQLLIGDVEKIEISESSIESYQNNGQGGSINIVLRSRGEQGGNLWGSAGAYAAYPLDLSPQVVIGARNEKFMARGILLGEYYNNRSYMDTFEFDKGNLVSTDSDTKIYRFGTELARAYLQYEPNQKNIFKLNVSHSYTYDRESTMDGHQHDKENRDVMESNILKALFNYQHQFTRGQLVFETQYSYNPSITTTDAYKVLNMEDKSKNHNVSGKLEYKANLIVPNPKRKTRAADLSLIAGSTFNGSFHKETIHTVFDPVLLEAQVDLTPNHNTFHVMPYAILEGGYGRFRYKAIGEYQFYMYDIRHGEMPYTIKQNDFTGKLMAEWHFTPHKNLRLILDRKLKRPSEDQLYPEFIISPSREAIIKGNAELLPAMSHEIAVDYIADYKWKENQALMFNVGASYNNTSRIIKSVDVENQFYTTFENSDKNHLVNLDLMALYSYGVFSCSFTGNLSRSMPQGSDDKSRTYCNFSISPYVTLKDGWNGGITFSYYSKVYYNIDSFVSDYSYASMNVGKEWKKLYVYSTIRVALQKRAKDKTLTSDNTYQIKEYEMFPSMAAIGFRYKF